MVEKCEKLSVIKFEREEGRRESGVPVPGTAFSSVSISLVPSKSKSTAFAECKDDDQTTLEAMFNQWEPHIDKNGIELIIVNKERVVSTRFPASHKKDDE